MIRRLVPGDATVLRDLRIRAITDAPSAFGASLVDQLARTLDEWEFGLRPDGHPFFACFLDGAACGLAGGLLPDETQTAHLVSMWIDPAHRGRGISDRLVDTVVAWAESTSAERLALFVSDGNEFAEQLYRRHGFVRTGASKVKEKDGLLLFEMTRALAGRRTR